MLVIKLSSCLLKYLDNSFLFLLISILLIQNVFVKVRHFSESWKSFTSFIFLYIYIFLSNQYFKLIFPPWPIFKNHCFSFLSYCYHRNSSKIQQYFIVTIPCPIMVLYLYWIFESLTWWQNTAVCKKYETRVRSMELKNLAVGAWYLDLRNPHKWFNVRVKQMKTSAGKQVLI